MLDPRLELWRGTQYPASGTPAFGVFMDSAPDRWGRVLMERREALLARQQSRPMRRLGELDFLLGVHDLTRTGALRFKATSGGNFLDDSVHAAPPLTSLPELAATVAKIEEPGAEELPEYAQWIALLIAPGTSLGGARPKASFTIDGELWMAKFPARDDRYDVGAWEYVVHKLAGKAGVNVPAARLERFGAFSTFCVQRFDRFATTRRMFASAMTLLEASESEGRSYLDLAEVISTHGAATAIARDLEQLFRRVVFNMLTANRDDHLRNHGFIRVASGWQLAPAFDMNPNTYRDTHVLSLDGAVVTPDVDAVLATSELYRLPRSRADALVQEVRAVVGGWKDEARAAGLGSTEIARMQRAFESV
jgi:serine/threonine-protein kinase HipA